MEKESREFKERKKLIEIQKEADIEKANLQKELEESRFNFRMDLLKFERESNKLFHDNELTRGRIKRAEERRIMAEKDHYFRNRGR